jgi:hypothetical protein
MVDGIIIAFGFLWHREAEEMEQVYYNCTYYKNLALNEKE